MVQHEPITDIVLAGPASAITRGHPTGSSLAKSFPVLLTRAPAAVRWGPIHVTGCGVPGRKKAKGLRPLHPHQGARPLDPQAGSCAPQGIA